MSLGRKKLFFTLSAAALGSATVLPMATGFAASNGDTTVEDSDTDLLVAAGVEALADRAPAQERVIDLERQAEIVDRILAADGDKLPPIATPAEPSPAAVEEDAELECLARVISHEARGEPREGQIAVAEVVMNRVESPRFPNTICGVVNQRAQFSNVRSYRPRRSGAQWDRIVRIAIDARNDVSEPVVGEALYFHASRVHPRFASTRSRVAQIGAHIFYR